MPTTPADFRSGESAPRIVATEAQAVCAKPDSTAGPVGRPLHPFHRRDALPRGTLMTVPTVVMMRKKKNGTRNRGKRNGGTEQAFAETLLYLADDWGHLSPEELARFLCESCQGNPEIKAFCRTIKLHFRA